MQEPILSVHTKNGCEYVGCVDLIASIAVGKIFVLVCFEIDPYSFLSDLWLCSRTAEWLCLYTLAFGVRCYHEVVDCMGRFREFARSALSNATDVLKVYHYSRISLLKVN